MSSTSTIPAPRLKPLAQRQGTTLFAVASTPRRALNYRLPVVLLFLTVMTTTLIGMRYMYNFNRGEFPLTSATDILPYDWAWNNLHLFSTGLPFSIALIAILLAHEFGHYAACRFYDVEATLPFIFPAPTLSGTFGAVIRIKSKIKSRAALMLIGASGPIAGFVVAISTTCYGLIHSKAIVGSPTPSMIRIGAPGLLRVLRELLLGSHPGIPPLVQMVPHPVLVASWIGLLITAINLIPAGQLDGGHIVYSISPRLHKISSNLMIGGLLYLGTFEWIGWLFWAFLLMMPSMRHPRVLDKAPLGLSGMVLAPICLAIFVLTASTQPATGMSLIQVAMRVHWGFWIR